MRITGRVPWEALRASGLFIGFARRNPGLDRFLPRRAASAQALLEAARADGVGHGEAHRAEVAAALADYAARFDAPEPVLEAAERLARPGTVAIVTGQQPGLFGGPLYSWHKVATALHLARALRALEDGPEVVTIFWNHSEDHDWGEANHSYLLNPALDVQRVRLRLPTTGKPLHAIPVGEDVALAADEARDLLPATDATEAELALLRPGSDDETLADHTARILFAHFGAHGLLVLEPRTLPSTLRTPLALMHADAEFLRGKLKGAAAELYDRGFDVTVDPEGPFLFRTGTDGKRRAVPDGEPCPDPETASPGVILRSVWQDTILPTLVYVAGPGEISYLALTRPFYERFDVPRPQLVLRVSLTCVEERLREHLEEWDLTLADLERGSRDVEELIAARSGVEEEASEEGGVPEEALTELAAELRERLRQLEPKVAEVDPNLCHPLARIGSRASSELRKFVQKLANQRRNRAGRFRQHARRLCGELRPRGRLQERVFPALPFLVRGRESFVRELLDVADPFADEHLLVTPDVP